MDNLTVANRAIGIDIGSHSVKVVSMQQRLGVTSIEKAAEVPLHHDGEGAVSQSSVVDALKAALEGIRVRKDIVTVDVSTQAAAVRSLPIPFADITKARAVIKFQAEPHLPFAIDDVIVDFFDMNTGLEDRMDVLLTAIRKQVLKERLTLVREVGIDPEVIEVDFMAVANTVNKSGEPSEEGLFLMNIGSSKTIVTFVKNGIPLALRSFPIGGDTITNAIAREMDVSFEEAERLKLSSASAVGDETGVESASLNRAVKSVLNRFSGEVGRTLRSFTSQLSDSGQYRAILTGGGALLTGMAEFMREILGHDVVVLESTESIKNNSGAELSVARFATAIGLGLRGLGETAFLQNFRQEELAYSQTYKRMRTSIYTSVGLLIAVFVLYIAGLVVKVQVLKERSGRLDSAVRKEWFATFGKSPGPGKNSADLVRDLRQQVIVKKKELNELRGTQLISALDVLKELSTLIPKETEIELTRFTVDDMGTDVRLTIEGTAKTKDDVFQIEDLIKRSPEFFDVQRGGLTLLGQRHKFDFVAKLREKQQ